MSSNVKKVAYYGFHDGAQFQIIQNLKSENRWDPICFIGDYKRQNESKENYPNAVFVDSMNVRQAIFDYSKISNKIPIDKNIIKALSEFELNFMGILEDSTGWNFSFYERKRFYFEVLEYWNSLINEVKPDIFVFFTLPHTPACYPLYLLCKYYYSIDVLFLDPVPLLGRNNHVIGSSVEDLACPFLRAYKSENPVFISNQSLKYLKEVRIKNAKLPAHIRKINLVHDKFYWFNWRLFLIALLRTMKNTFSGKERVAWKKNTSPHNSSLSKFSYMGYFWFIEQLRYKNKFLLKQYNNFCIEPDFEKKYLYFAAPYQPEATTATNAGVYEDLFLVISMLSSSVPEDWVIYYKENPVIFAGSTLSKGSLRRDKYFFKKMAQFKNVELISPFLDTFNLIDNSQAVATVAGTASWESVVRGKPSLSFGSVWYMGCDSIFSIKSLKDVKIAIHNIVAGYKPDPSDIERYVASIESVLIKDMVQRDFYDVIKRKDDIPYEMKRIAEALHDAYERYYGSKSETS